MRLRVPLLSIASLGFAVLLYGAPPEQNDQQDPKQPKQLTGAELLAEYERLIPINLTAKQGHWPEEHYPKTLGTFNSQEVKEVFFCGDVCPQYGFVFLTYSNVKEQDCAAIGQPVYSHTWGPQYRGCSPLISRNGSLVESGYASWSLTYLPEEGRSKTLMEEPLRFDDSSLCSKHGEKVSCTDFHVGQKASLKATKSGTYLAVLKLEL
jgi:hypothetical protein